MAIIILNFGSQFAHLLARRVRDLGVKAEILPFNSTIEDILRLKPSGVILSGGPSSVLQKGSPRPDARIFSLGIPVLGVCYGHQVMAAMRGGRVAKGTVREFGRETLFIKNGKRIFSGLTRKETVWFSHGDHVRSLGKEFKITASSTSCRIAAFEHERLPLYAIQFHPEAAHTTCGKAILTNFLFSICKAKKDWNTAAVRRGIITRAAQQVGSGHVLLGISGGVDSLVAAALLHRAVGKRLHAVFVNTGLLREGEIKEVAAQIRTLGFGSFRVVDAEKLFLHRLRSVTDPEQKRRIIGHTFIEVFEKTIRSELKKYPIAYFAQGTIYPDRIESASVGKAASKIKSHHNLTLPERFKLTLVEPLRDLYKDEVRRIGLALKLPRRLIYRHPFPGPGLAVRIVGEVTKDRLRILRQVDAIFIDELRKAGEYEKIWQAFAVLLPLRTVGVMGDKRTYEYMVSLRAVDSMDGMTADWHKMPAALLEKISSAIVGRVRGVNRVLYDVTQKPPATIEYE